MQQLMSYMRSAMDRYHMVQDGDRIAVGVSGGKDSLALLAALAQMRQFYPAGYSLTAITLDPCFEGAHTDYTAVEELCTQLDVPFIVRRTRLWQVIFKDRQEKNPCSLCARMRRGILHDEARSAGCNKIALGHHLDDAAETYYMNLFNGGHMGCFSPVSYLSRKNLTMIRPMIFASERAVEQAAQRNRLPVIKSRCSIDGSTERQAVKDLLSRLEKTYPGLREKTVGALQRANIDGW